MTGRLGDSCTVFSGGSKRGARDACPPSLVQNFFIFMQFLGKIGQIIDWRPPPLGLASPPLGNPGSATGFPSCFMVHITITSKIKFMIG